ncbi:MAG: hypothetical protein MZV70_54985 [Desulfobacterales bacterium]|nr:hypothetical protein [Desulfobacterales bacterium]
MRIIHLILHIMTKLIELKTVRMHGSAPKNAQPVSTAALIHSVSVNFQKWFFLYHVGPPSLDLLKSFAGLQSIT